MPGWYVLYTRPRHEKQVFTELSKKKVEAFLPTYKVRRRWSDRYKVVEEPLFKNYLFINVDLDRFNEVLQSYGAVRFVNFDGKPAQISQNDIDAIRRLVDSELSYDPHPYLKVGRRVRVRSGPLKGCTGILTRKKGLARLVLNVDLLQQSVSAEIDTDCVEPV
jgi:transcription elongation factor/antiterminator RfaH